MSWSLSRLLLANLIAPFFGIMIFLVSFMLTFQVAKILALLSGQDIGIVETTKLILSICVNFFPLVTPLSLFFASIYCFYRLSSESEFIAMRSFGYSNKSLFIVLFIFSFTAGLTLYFLNQETIPRAKAYFVVKLQELKSKKIFSQLNEGQFYTEMRGLVFFAETFDRDSFTMRNVFAEIQSKSNKGYQVVMAKSGKFEWDRTDGRENVLNVILKDGNMNSYGFGDKVQKVLFQTYKYPVVFEDVRMDEMNKGSAMTRSELNRFLKLSPQELKKRKATSEDYNRALLEFYDRWNTPILCVLFSFLGMLLGVSHFRSKGRNIAIWSLGSLMLYFGTYFFLVGLARKGDIAAILSITIPMLLLSGTVIYLSRRFNWLG